MEHEFRFYQKTTEAGRSLWLSPCPSPLKQVIKPSPRVPTLYPEKRSILSLKTKGHWEEFQPTSLPSVPQFITLTLYSLNAHISHNCPLCIKPSVKTFRFNWFFQVLILLSRFLCHVKLILNLFAFFLLICLRWFNFQTQSETLKGLPYKVLSQG